MSRTSEMNALAGAFGSIIGYLGAEAAEPTIFETLLWPQRFYNNNTPVGAIAAAILMPMGGPLHKAALEVLDSFRRRGLYLGARAGHMLGTAFYPNSKLTYKMYGYTGEDHDNEVRNGLWATVIRRLRNYQHSDLTKSYSDGEAKVGETTLIRRTTQRIQHLKMSRSVGKPDKNTVVFNECHTSVTALITMIFSELGALACAFAVIYLERCYWFAGYLCLPLVLKLASATVTVRRECLKPFAGSAATPEQSILVEISDYDHGFPLIEGPEPLVRQFFRHYSHPKRENRFDRAREVTSIVLVFALVLNFPLGLLSMLFVQLNVQIVWLSYQMHMVIIMHVNRLAGYEGPARMEDAMAKALAAGRKIRLECPGMSDNGVGAAEVLGVDVTLESEHVPSIKDGRRQVKNKVAAFERGIPDLVRLGSEKSESGSSADTLVEKS